MAGAVKKRYCFSEDLGLIRMLGGSQPPITSSIGAGEMVHPVKCTCCLFRGPRLNSLHHMSVTPVAGDALPSSESLSIRQTHGACTQAMYIR